MKKFLISTMIFLGTNVFALTVDFKATCLLMDMALENSLLVNTPIELKAGDKLAVATYKNYVYQVAVYDSSGTKGKRINVILAVFDAKTNTVVGASSSTYATEVPDMMFQHDKNVLFSCSQL